VFVLRAIVSQVCFFDCLESVENGGVLDRGKAEELIANYREKLAMYRKDPDGFAGRPRDVSRT